MKSCIRNDSDGEIIDKLNLPAGLKELGAGHGFTNSKVHFLAELSGKSTVGTNLSTNATGNAIFTVTEDGNEMSYTVNTMRINHVTDVVLVFSTGGHTNNVALLRLGTQHGATGPIKGLLVHGNITSSNLVGPLEGKHILDLAKDMLDGNIYLRVSTNKFPLVMIGKINPAE